MLHRSALGGTVARTILAALLFAAAGTGNAWAGEFPLAPYSDFKAYITGRYIEVMDRLDTEGGIDKINLHKLDTYCHAAYAGKYYDKLERCLAAYEKREPDAMMRILRIRAQYQLDIGALDKAVADAKRLISILPQLSFGLFAPRVPHIDYNIPALGVLAISYALAGDKALAADYLRQLETTFTTSLGSEQSSVRAKQVWLSRAYIANGNYQRAYEVTRADEGASILEAFGDNDKQIPVLWLAFNKHKSEFETGRLAEAKEGFDRMLAVPAVRANGGIHWVLAYDRGRLAEKEANLAEAIRFYRQAVEAIESQRSTLSNETSKMGFVGSKQNVYRDLIRLLMRQDDIGAAFDYVERSKARALVDMLAGKRDFVLPSGSAERVRALLAQADAAEIAANASDISEAAEKRRGQVAERRRALVAEAGELASLVSVETLSVPGMQKELAAEETLIEYYYGGDDLYAFVLTRSAISAIRLTAGNLEADIHAFRQAIQEHGSQNWKRHAKPLHDRLIAPLRDKVNTPSVTIVGHGALHYLPFGALHDGERFLIERYSIRLLPAATVLKYLKAGTVSKPGTLLALGNPDLGDRRLDLAFAQSEAETIVKTMPNSRALTRAGASKSAFRKYAADFRLLHIASHGEFDAARPLASALLLAREGGDDGKLTVSELYSMRLDADLVTLSACETGLGKVSTGDDVVGLTRGFLYAGTRSVVASLWQVDDRSTGELMTSFYQALGKGAGRRDALRSAQLDFLRKQPHPFFWAAFQLTGTP
jgi:CHAT domain-containing protein